MNDSHPADVPSDRAAEFSPRGRSEANSEPIATQAWTMPPTLPGILNSSRVRVVFGPGKLAELGPIAKSEGATHVLLVTDPGIEQAGHPRRAMQSLRAAGLIVTVFDGVCENPTTEHVEAGVRVAQQLREVGQPVDLIIGLGGGSSMDCAKGINFVYTNGGKMSDYWGVGKAAKPMLTMIAVPTTAGTGSEAQSFALICDPRTHQKMACGDKKALCRVAILDPELTATQPPFVAAATGIDALSHAIETAATTKRNAISLEFTREAWARLGRSYPEAMRDPTDSTARGEMLLGAHLAGSAIEQSMLGAAHACANPLTARCGITHGVAVGVMLPHVIRSNARNGENPYAAIDPDAQRLAHRVEQFLAAGSLPTNLASLGVPESILPDLAAEAALQWTARFNPRPVEASDLVRIYRAAFR